MSRGQRDEYLSSFSTLTIDSVQFRKLFIPLVGFGTVRFAFRLLLNRERRSCSSGHGTPWIFRPMEIEKSRVPRDWPRLDRRTISEEYKVAFWRKESWQFCGDLIRDPRISLFRANPFLPVTLRRGYKLSAHIGLIIREQCWVKSNLINHWTLRLI